MTGSRSVAARAVTEVTGAVEAAEAVMEAGVGAAAASVVVAAADTVKAVAAAGERAVRAATVTTKSTGSC